jgi:hypothetical protein
MQGSVDESAFDTPHSLTLTLRGSSPLALDMGHRGQPKVQVVPWKPSINAGAIADRNLSKSGRPWPYVWVHPDEER